MNVQVKICGMTRARDVSAARRLGVNALGFVFAKSPRQLTPAVAARLTALAGDGIMRVGLFMDQAPRDIEAILAEVELDMLQFHGSETNAFCTRFGMPFLKAVSMQGADPHVEAAAFPAAAGILLDSHATGSGGGTGAVFDWAQAPRNGKPVWLAGGLNPGNVASAIAAVRPFAVDVSSGVERAPGIKDESLMEAFIEQARGS